MHKSIFALAALVAATSLLLFSLTLHRSGGDARAQALGPVVTGGAHPWLDFAGSLGASAHFDVYTVPADRVFVMTSLCMNGDVNMNELDPVGNEWTRVYGATYAGYCGGGSNTGGYLSAGRGHVTFTAGSTVRFRNPTSGTRKYNLEGYLAVP